MEISSQPSRLSYIHGDVLEAEGLAVLLTYENNDTQTVPFSGFSAFGITVYPDIGTQLSFSLHNNTPISVSLESFYVNTNNLLVNQKELTVLEVSHIKQFDGNTSADGIYIVLGGIVGSDDVIVSVVNAMYTSADVGTKTIIINSITISGNDVGNYFLTLPSGVVSVTGGIVDYPGQTLPIYINEISGGDFELTLPSNVILSRTGAGGYLNTMNISVTFSGNFTVEWYYNGELLHSGSTLGLSVSNNHNDAAFYAPYNIVGQRHLLTVVVTIGGTPYSDVLEFEVRQ